jgi:membrane-associated phospholipid phosphatase
LVTLGWLFVRTPDRFRLLRDAMFISGGIGLLIFALYPVSPPRFGALEVVDTVSDRSRAYRTLQPPGLINPYAAMPSLHFGWNLLVGVIIWNSTRNRALRAFALVMPLLMAFAVVATANHYVVDVVVGGALALFGLLLAHRLPGVISDPFRRRVE